MKSLFFTALIIGCLNTVIAQPFYFGADLSYVNEMEDCGVVYKQDGVVKDVYEIFTEHDVNIVRLRLWHTPSWYDNLNDGNRYSDLADVKRAISRAKEAGMDVLLDFHLSDNWADPSKQVVPAAWAPVVDDLPVLKDSLYNYVYAVLSQLNAEDLLPEIVQIGNETNKGILQSQAANDGGWVLNWNRNSQLFNIAIDAVQAIEVETGKNIRIAIHVADPEDAVWLFRQFIENGVTEFDVMGISYYWAWHQPIGIAQTGQIIEDLLEDYPAYDVMIFETGYIWTTQSNDNANNIINSVHPDYSPASPLNQRLWLEALTQEVISSGGTGVMCWEPAWQSSPCRTQWGQGSHQEHATFFDFDNNLLEDGGIRWPLHAYEGIVSTTNPPQDALYHVSIDSNMLIVKFNGNVLPQNPKMTLVNATGQIVVESNLGTGAQSRIELPLSRMSSGIYYAVIASGGERIYVQEVLKKD